MSARSNSPAAGTTSRRTKLRMASTSSVAVAASIADMSVEAIDMRLRGALNWVYLANPNRCGEHPNTSDSDGPGKGGHRGNMELVRGGRSAPLAADSGFDGARVQPSSWCASPRLDRPYGWVPL